MDLNSIVVIAQDVLDVRPSVGFFLDFVLKSTLVLLLAFVASFLCRKFSAALRHLLWCLAILSLSCLPLFLSFVPKLELSISQSVDNSYLELSPQIVSQSIENITEIVQVWWQPVLALYFVVVFILLAYVLTGLINIVLLNRASSLCKNSDIQDSLNKILIEQLSEQKIQVLENSAVNSPLSWGLWNPTIILPVSSQQWSSQKLDNVLLHEMSHINRLDWLTHLLGRYACALYWFNPLVWLAARKMGEEAEQACDDAVLVAGSPKENYAQDLLQFARDANNRSLGNILAEAIANSFLGSRVIAILDVNRARQTNDIAWVARGLLGAFAIVSVLASIQLVPAVDLKSFNAAVNNLMQVRFVRDLSPRVSTLEPVVSVPPDRAEYLLSTNLPPLETIYVEASLADSIVLSVDNELRSPLVSLQELANGNSRDNSINLLNKSFPEYPLAARRRNIEGFTLVEYDITPIGRVINPVVIDSQPNRIFDQSSLRALKDYLYEPPKVNGQAMGIKGLRTRFVYQLTPEPG